MTEDVGGFPYKHLLNDWEISEWKRKKRQTQQNCFREKKYRKIVHGFL